MTRKSHHSPQKSQQRGLVESDSTKPSFLAIGQVLKPHGVHGEVRVRLITDMPERFTWLETVYVDEKNPVQVAVESVRFHQEFVLLKLAAYDSREAAQGLRGKILLVPDDEAIPLAEGEYFLYQLEGVDVHSDEGDFLGKIVRVIETGANNVFVILGDDREILLPDIDEVVLEIDFEANRMLVHVIPGLI